MQEALKTIKLWKSMTDLKAPNRTSFGGFCVFYVTVWSAKNAKSAKSRSSYNDFPRFINRQRRVTAESDYADHYFVDAQEAVQEVKSVIAQRQARRAVQVLPRTHLVRYKFLKRIEDFA